MTPQEWEKQWLLTYNQCYEKKRSHMWAFGRAHEIMKETYGPKPKEQKVHEPNLLDYAKLGFQFKRMKMGAFKSPGAIITALGAAFTAASVQFGIANADNIITGGEWAGIALQFFTLFLGTVAKFAEKPPVDKDGNIIDRRGQ